MMRRTVIVGGMVMLAASGTSAAIKMSQQDAQRVQQHTGLPPEQLEDQDLEQAMQELAIQPQPLTPQEQAAMAQQGNQPPAQTPQAHTVQGKTASSAGMDQPNYLNELKQLAELRDQGIITEQDFQAKKQQLLGL